MRLLVSGKYGDTILQFSEMIKAFQKGARLNIPKVGH